MKSRRIKKLIKQFVRLLSEYNLYLKEETSGKIIEKVR